MSSSGKRRSRSNSRRKSPGKLPNSPPTPSSSSSSTADLASKLAAAEAAAAAALAEVNELKAAAAANATPTPQKHTGHRRSSSRGKSSPKPVLPATPTIPLDKVGAALLAKTRAFVLRKKLAMNDGGDPGSPLRVKTNPDRERELTDMYIVEELGAKDVLSSSSTKSNSPLLGLLTTAPMETAALVGAMKGLVRIQVTGQEQWTYYLGTLGETLCVTLKTDQSAGGRRGAQQACTALRNDWPSVRSIIAPGIAWGGAGQGLKFADVLVSTFIQDYDHQWIAQDGKISLMGLMYTVPPELASGLTAPIPGSPVKAVSGLMIASRKGFNNEYETLNAIKTVSSHCKKPVVGGEMEGAGLIAAAGPIPVAIVKAVVDFGGVGEEKGKEHQPRAAASAVAFLEAAIRRGDWVNDLPIPRGAGLKRLDASVFVADKTRGFIGREGLFKQLETWRTGQTQEQVLVVKGDPGIGKSAWASTVVTRDAANVAASHFCRYDDPVSLQGGAWLGNVCSQLLDWALKAGFTPSSDCDRAVLERGSGSVKAAWKSFLEAFKLSVDYTGPNVLLVVDSLDEAVDVGGDSGTQILEALAGGVRDMPSWLKVIATSRDESHVLDKIQSSLPGVKEIKSSDDENLSDLKQYVVAQMGPGAKVEDVETVLKASDGNFMYAVQLLRHKAAGDLSKLLKQGSVPSGLQELYSAMAKRLFPTSAEFEKALPLLNVLAAAKAPLPRAVLDGAMKAAGLKEVTVRSYLVGLDSVLEASGSIVRIYHKSFGDWLVETGYRGSRFPILVDVREGHDLLARACTVAWPAAKGTYVDSYTCHHAVEGSGATLNDAIKAIGGVDAEAGEWWTPEAIDADDEEPRRATLLWMAARAGNTDVIRALVKEFHSKAVDEAHSDGETPLFTASQHGHADVVRALVKEFQSKSIDTADSEDCTPVWIASSRGHVEVVRVLLGELKSKAVSTPDMDGLTPLHAASQNGHVAVARVLLNEFKSPNLDTPDQSDGSTPLILACTRGQFELAEMLITEFKCELDTQDHYGQTPLRIAAEEGHSKICSLLLRHGSKAVDTQDRAGKTPLWGAASEGHLHVVRLLMGEGKSSELDTVHRLGQTPLWIAVKGNHVALVKALVTEFKSKALDTADLVNKQTPLFVACEHGWTDMVALLLVELNSGAVDTADKNQQCPLHAAAASGHLQCVRLLLSKGQSKALDRPEGQYKRTPLALAAASGKADVVKALLTEFRSKSVDTVDDAGISPVWAAAAGGHASAVEVLVKEGHSHRMDAAMEIGGETPLFVACARGHLSVVRALINLGTKAVDKPSDFGQTPLSAAAERGSLPIVRLLLSDGASKAVDIPNNAGDTPLHLAAFVDEHVDVVRALVKEGRAKSIDTTNNAGETPLHRAAEAGNLHVVRALVSELGSKAVDARDSNASTPLILACSANRASVVRSLVTELHSKAVDLPGGKDYLTPLAHASRAGHFETVKTLLRECSSKAINFASDKTGDTALILAVRAWSRGSPTLRPRFRPVIRELIAHGADPTIANKEGKTAADFHDNGRPDTKKKLEDLLSKRN